MSEFDVGRYTLAAREHAERGNYEQAVAVLEAAQRDSRMPHFLRDSFAHSIVHYRSKIKRLGQLPEVTRRIGVVCPKDRSKGLYRDWETIAWALSRDETCEITGLVVPSSLHRFDYGNCESHAFPLLKIQAGRHREATSTLSEWLDSLDCIIILEALNESLLRALREKRCERSVIYMPNLEWATCDPENDDSSSWLRVLTDHRASITTIARTRGIQEILRSAGIASVEIPWSVPDEVVKRTRRPVSPVRVLMNCGNFGYKDRRGFDIAYRALEILANDGCKLSVTLKANKSFNASVERLRSSTMQVEVITRFFKDRDDVLELYDNTDIVVYPSRFEGLGLGILEAVHRGAMVLVTDGYPMKELVSDGWPKIKADLVGRLRLANCYEPCPHHLASILADIASNPDAIRTPADEALVSRQNRFRDALSSLIREVSAGDRIVDLNSSNTEPVRELAYPSSNVQQVKAGVFGQ